MRNRKLKVCSDSQFWRHVLIAYQREKVMRTRRDDAIDIHAQATVFRTRKMFIIV